MLVIKDLMKTYSSGVQALKGINLEIQPGMFGLLGPNGAGKTTLMKILATLLEPDSGAAQMDSLDLIAAKGETRKKLGYLPQDFGLYPTLTAAQMLDYFAKLKGVADKNERRSLVDALLDRVNLSAERNRRLGGFSGGMRQRMGIAQALIGNPKLLIVDEPTAGLDPEERVRFRNLLSDMSSERTIILSTHIVEDISQSCNDLAVMRAGRVLFRGSPADLIERARGYVWVITTEKRPDDRLTIVSSLQLQRGIQYRVLGDPDGYANATAVEPSLE